MLTQCKFLNGTCFVGMESVSLVSTSGEGFEFENKVLASLLISFRSGHLNGSKYTILPENFTTQFIQPQLFQIGVLTDDIGIFGILDGDFSKSSKVLISVKRQVHFSASDQQFKKTVEHAAIDISKGSISAINDRIILLFSDAPNLLTMQDLLLHARASKSMIIVFSSC